MPTSDATTKLLAEQLERGLAGAGGAAIIAGGLTGVAILSSFSVTGAGSLAAAGVLAFAAGNALGYVIVNGGNSTPEGAANAFLQGGNGAMNFVGNTGYTIGKDIAKLFGW